MKPKVRTDLPRQLLLAGAGLLAVWATARLPPPRELLHAPETPYDHADIRETAVPAFRLLSRIADAIPRGATATVLTEPRDAAQETSLHGAAVALLPGRRVFPGAQWSVFTPQYESQAEYVIVVGPSPAPAPGILVRSVEGGTVWRRNATP